MQKEIITLLRSIKNFLASKFKKYDSKLPYIIIAVVAIILVLVGIKLFVEFTEVLMRDLLEDYDTKISEAIWSYRSQPLTDYLMFVTNVGDVTGYIIVFILSTIIFFLVFRNWKYIGQLTLVLVLALSSNVYLKQLINRARPDNVHMVTVETLSYPSGHAMMSMAFYGLLIWLFFHFKMNKMLKVGAITLLAILIFSIGISRIYLGVHFPSDIVGGWLAGFIWVVFCVLIFNLIKIFRRDPGT